MALHHEATLYCSNVLKPDADKVGQIIEAIPIRSFWVEGGSNRTINLGSATDFSLTSELEQARSFKNITLIMSPTKDHADMKAAMNLTGFADRKTDFMLLLTVKKQVNKIIVEYLNLADRNATMKKPPTLTSQNFLRIEAVLPAAELDYSKHQTVNGVIKVLEMEKF